MILINNDILQNYPNIMSSLNTLEFWVLLNAPLGHELTRTGTLVGIPLMSRFLDRKFERGFSTEHQERGGRNFLKGRNINPQDRKIEELEVTGLEF